MTLVVGTDEAGYGPNLGPLVVAATVWEVAGGAEAAEAALERATAEAGRLWGDSKAIFRGGAGFAALERGALAGFAVVSGGLPDSGRSFAAALGATAGQADPEPQSAVFDALCLPRGDRAAECLAAASDVARGLARVGVCLRLVRARVIQPREFNRLLDAGLNKSDILSQATLDLAAPLVAEAGSAPVLVWCDRHGGRRRYSAVVSRSFAAPLVQAVTETPQRSVYRIPDLDCRIEFCVRGESRLPVALASMTAKYVRELSMHAFNAFWGERQPGLRPTAGYPLDAARWRDEAAPAVRAAGVGWDDLWRRV
jgi:ribonuclease HII